MKFFIEKDFLLNAVSKLIGVAEKSNSLPILNNVLLDLDGNVLRLVATNLETETAVRFTVFDVLVSGTTTVNARKLYEALKRFPNENVKIELKKEKLEIQCKSSRISLATLHFDAFPIMDPDTEKTQEITLSGPDLLSSIRKTAYAMAATDVRYYLNGLNFNLKGDKSGNYLTISASDGHRLTSHTTMLENIPGELPETSIIIQRRAVTEIVRFIEKQETVKILISRNYVKFTNDNDTSYLLTKLIEGKFPNIHRVIPTDNPIKVTIDVPEFKSALQRAIVTSSEKISPVKININETGLTIKSNDDNNNESENACTQVKSNWKPFEIGLNGKYLLDAVQFLETKEATLLITENINNFLISDPNQPNYTMLIMPLRL